MNIQLDITRNKLVGMKKVQEKWSYSSVFHCDESNETLNLLHASGILMNVMKLIDVLLLHNGCPNIFVTVSEYYTIVVLYYILHYDTNNIIL